jgi:hypothetical protein
VVPSARLTIREAERRFVRIRIVVPPGGLGRQPDEIKAWLDANCGAGDGASGRGKKSTDSVKA